jgi:predicted O-linked N-acetylglucosamine transferase (SPINDLY family)
MKKKNENITIEKLSTSAFQNHQKRDLKVAEKLYKKILKLNPNHFESNFYLGIISAQTNNFNKAKQLLNKAIQIQPNFIDAHYNLGNVQNELGEFEQAASSYQKAIEIQPNYANAHYNLGLILKKLGKFEKAISSYKKAIEINPNFIAAYNNLGIVFKELKEFERARNSYQKAIEIQPNYASAHYNLGNVQNELGEFEQAASSYQKAIEIQPNYASAYNNLGNVQNELGVFEQAASSYQKAIEIQPNYASAYHNLGFLLSNLGKYDEATQSCRQAIKIKTDYAKAYSMLLFNLNYKTDFNPNLYLTEARKFRINCKPKKSLSFKHQYEKKPTKLRLGLISADFGNHPGGFHTLSTLRELRKKNFELIAYTTTERRDEFSYHFRPLFSKSHSIEKKKDEEVVEQIVKDGIHILMDLQGHSAKNRLPIFMYKSAPIQVSWLGQGSTGILEIDYFIGSPLTIPKNEENHYVEKILRLPEIEHCFTPPDFNVAINNLPALKNNFVTFGCINKLTKVNDDVIALWSKVLSSVPNSKLFLKSTELDDQKIVENTHKRFKKNKIDKNRLILHGKSPTRKEVLETYNEIDIALDPFPFQGNTSTEEAVWMGVPVLTLKGNRFLFHFGESINSNLNMHDWIAKNYDEYVSKAIKFSSNLDELSKIRMNLRQIALQSPVFDAPRFAEHFSKMLWDMWKKLNKKL